MQKKIKILKNFFICFFYFFILTETPGKFFSEWEQVCMYYIHLELVMRISFVNIKQTNSVDFVSAVNLIYWELVALLDDFLCQEALLSYVYPPVTSTRPFLSDYIWVQLLVESYVSDWKDTYLYLWMDRACLDGYRRLANNELFA